MQVGLKDQPIVSRDQEALGLGEYAEVLTEFIRHCDTPLTIALQGDWGSGKTSLMTLIRNELQDERHHTVWFNTWQYAQFNMSDTLALSMMSKISDALAPDKGGDGFQALKRSLWAASRAVVIGGASVIGQGDTAKAGIEEYQRGGKDGVEEDPAAALERIKDGLAKIVEERIAGPTEKIVVFVDDLDRLVPERAVELLEAMKVFLDIDRCVYVIACDYGVVSAGLKSKFGVSEGELKGKSFFDKIIQVPFKMPTRRYQVNDYIKRLLTQIGVDYDSDRDIGKYSELVEHSVGFNPRTMKRLLNSLQLLTILQAKQDRREPTGRSDAQKEVDRRRHAHRVMFAILCMLERYEAIYDHLTADEPSAGRIIALRDGLKEGEKFAEIREKVAGIARARAESRENGTEIDAEALSNAVEFVRTFVDCLQLDDDDSLSDDEIRHLQEMLSYSALVSAGRQLQEFVPRNFALSLRRHLNGRYVSFVQGTRPKYEKFSMSGGKVYFYLPHGDYEWYLEMGRDDEDMYYFSIVSGSEDWEGSVKLLGSMICERLSWEPGSASEVEIEGGWTEWHYRFFSQDAAAQSAEEAYRTELCRRLDALTKPRALLRDLCRDAKAAADDG